MPADGISLPPKKGDFGTSRWGGSKVRLYQPRDRAEGAVGFRGQTGKHLLTSRLTGFDPNRTLAGSKSRTATALTELRQSDMVPARLV
jgi:hypothetical protein